MFKKNRQLIIGFVLGALVFGIIPVGATVQEYILKKSSAKLMVDEKEFSNKELPVLLYKGYNYIPAATFREICDIIGVGFEYVGEKNEIQINTKKNVIAEKEPLVERKGENMETVEIEKDGYKLLVIDGIEYINIIDARNTSDKYDFTAEFLSNSSDVRNFENAKLVRYPEKWVDRDTYTVLIESVDITKVEGRKLPYFIEYDYFLKTMLPIMKEQGAN